MSTEIRAQNSLALTSVKAIKDATDRSNELLGQMQQAAEEAGTTLEGIYADAEDAKANADSAKQSADIAFKQLGFVENIVGVLDLVARNGVYELTQDAEAIQDKWYFERTGISPNYVYKVVTIPTTYSLTTDTEIDPSKTYYTRSGTAPDYVYLPVENPVVEDIGTYYEEHKDPTGYYELTDIKQSIQNYVASHLVLLNDGLWLQASDNEAKIQISTEQGNEGVIIYGSDNKALAHYGSTSVIGDKEGFHIEIDGQEIGFYNNTTQVAFMSGSSLYVENNLSFGHFIFLERPNGHFTLKLID